MKTIEELFNEVKADKGLQEELMKAGKTEKVAEFLKDHGCDATAEEFIAFIKAKAAEEDAPLSQEELAQSAGGLSEDLEIAFSILSLGTLCAAGAAISALVSGRHVGKDANDTSGGGRLCNEDPK